MQRRSENPKKGKKLANWARFTEDSRGFTLAEVILVLAIIGILGLTVIPIMQDNISKARSVSAHTETKNIGTAIAGFFNDTAEFPTRKGADRNIIEVLRSGDDDSSLDPDFATGITELWGLTEVDDLNNHLLIDNPGGTFKGYKDNNANWRGSYMADVGQDPWGRNYLVIAKGFYDKGTDASPIYAWILSAGPNETIETDIDSERLNSDPATDLSSSSDDEGFLISPLIQ